MARVLRLLVGLYAGAAILVAAGCGVKKERVTPSTPPTNAVAGTPAAQGFIKDVTGKTALDQGRVAQDKIRKISAERDKDLDEVTK